MKNLVIHHSADFDGLFCREIAKRSLPDETDFIGWDFPHPALNPHLLEEYGRVFIMDLPCDAPFGWKFKDGWICVGNEEKMPLDRWDNSQIVWIDHHASAIASHPRGIPGYRIDGVAACRLAWQWFHPIEPPMFEGGMTKVPRKEAFLNREVKEPLAVRLVGEYDIWDHRGDGDLEFQFGLRTLNPDEVPYDLFFDGTGESDCAVCDIVELGQKILAYASQTNAAAMSRSFVKEWEGLKFLCLNTASCNSLTFRSKDTPETGHDALLAFYFNGDSWNYSLYHAEHRKDLDLAAIAVRHGGGGHKGACGFRSKSLILSA